MIPASKVYAMLENDSLWTTAQQCHAVLEAAGVAHVIMGGVAVCLHGYQRNTVDLDLLVRKQDTPTLRQTLEQAEFTWHEATCEFRSPQGIPVQFLLAGDRAGSGSEVLLPDPTGDTVRTEIEGLPVLSLAKLIESKIACGLGNLRRTHKDFADVVELIDRRQLRSSFARHLHKSVRPTFRELIRHARGETSPAG